MFQMIVILCFTALELVQLVFLACTQTHPRRSLLLFYSCGSLFFRPHQSLLFLLKWRKRSLPEGPKIPLNKCVAKCTERILVLLHFTHLRCTVAPPANVCENFKLSISEYLLSLYTFLALFWLIINFRSHSFRLLKILVELWINRFLFVYIFYLTTFLFSTDHFDSSSPLSLLPLVVLSLPGLGVSQPSTVTSDLPEQELFT